MSEFDPSAAAARATGELADRDPDAGTSSSADTDAADGDDGDTSDGDDGEDVVGLGGALAAYVTPLFVAPERGPTASTFEDYDVSTPWARILDGLTDYLLDVADVDVGDSLGPIGKIGLGLTSIEDDDAGDDQTDTSESSSNDGDDGAPVIEGVDGT